MGEARSRCDKTGQCTVLITLIAFRYKYYGVYRFPDKLISFLRLNKFDIFAFADDFWSTDIICRAGILAQQVGRIRFTVISDFNLIILFWSRVVWLAADDCSVANVGFERQLFICFFFVWIDVQRPSNIFRN